METGENSSFGEENKLSISPQNKKASLLTEDAASNSNLLICISENTISVCVIHTSRKVVSHFFTKNVLKSIQGKTNILERELKEMTISKFRFKKVLFSYTSNNYTLVPEGVYDDSNKEAWFNFNLTEENEGSIFSDYLKSLESYLVYKLPEYVNTTIKSFFPNAQFLHHASVFIETVLIETKNSKENSVYINRLDGVMDIVVVSSGNLLLATSHKVETDEDCTYFLLYTMDQLEINSQQTPVFLCGSIRKSNNLHSILQNYISKLVFPKSLTSALKLDEAIQVEKNDHYIILNQHRFLS